MSPFKYQLNSCLDTEFNVSKIQNPNKMYKFFQLMNKQKILEDFVKLKSFI